MARAGGAMAREAVGLLGVENPRARVLEIGFGPGVGIAVLSRVLPNGEIIGVDPSDVSHRNAAARNSGAIARGSVVLLSGTAQALPLPDAHCDAAIFVDNLHFWPDPLAGLAEVRRVLQAGSPVLCAFTPPSGGPPSRLRLLFEAAGFVEIAEHESTNGYLLRAVHPALVE
ncbi:class I SAM-dependent methyltransferase [Microbacterium sp. LWH12-1.2]|uniref:class I SAM-dependent methyltransferase n=1 Tax=Microbacterium sp. LWH12-1.2 TaxID=3135259 RepID=UPI0034185709